MGLPRKLLGAAVALLLSPILLYDYLRPSTGRAHGLTTAQKLVLAARMAWNNIRVPSASNFINHLVMASRILAVPPGVEGVIVECGCYRGGSTCNLSLVARACRRRLHVFDSFQGLPTPTEEDGSHHVLTSLEKPTYEEGAFRGSLDEVRGNVERFGAVEVCEFHPGFFDTSMDGFGAATVFAYLDVDLVQSEKDCLRALWPVLRDGCYLFTDEAHHREMAGLFHDREWWASTLDTEPPGLVGGGSGLGLFPQPGGFGSSLGYTIKNPETLGMTLSRQIG